MGRVLLSNEEFISLSKAKYGDKFKYDKCKYKGSRFSITLKCPVHGYFETGANNHMKIKGHGGCIKCSAKYRKLTQKEWLEKARSQHGMTYDYSKVKYTNTKEKVIIICSKHGEFSQQAGAHIQGNGCVHCARRDTVDDFIRKAKELHGGDYYDYSKVEYLGGATPVEIGCPEHGYFMQRPNNHLSGNDCPKCSPSYKLTNDGAIERFTKVHGDKYDYSKVVYQGGRVKVVIVCKVHGDFMQEPRSHISGSGCPDCNHYKFRRRG